MAIELTGGGKGNIAKVTKRNRLATEAMSNLRGYYISRDDEQMFGVTSHDATAAADTEIFYLQNTSSTRLMFIDLLRVGGVETALWKVWKVTGTAAGGNALTPTNFNLSSGINAEATCRGDDSVTGLTLAEQITAVRTAATSNENIPFDDTLILGQNDAIAVEYDAGTTGIAEVFCRFFYEKATDLE